jgi:SAM-dependent methyltransferase
MNGLINWEAIHRHGHMGPPMGSDKDKDAPKMNWDHEADTYDGMAKLEKQFTLNQVNQMILSPDDSVVDIGCGPGRLSVPIAKRVKRVTSVDASQGMLAKCMENARTEGVTNITPINLDWLEKGAEQKVGIHDVAIASRSVGASDLLKISRIARKYVFLLGWANAPSLAEIYHDFLEGIPRNGKPHRGPPRRSDDPYARMFSYNMTFNMVYDLGVNPNVVVVDDGFERDYATREQAYADLSFVGTIPPEFEEQYRSNVDRYVLPKPEGGFKLLRKTKTYVLWWRPEEINFS